MKSIQYTIRKVPKALDQKLRTVAEEGSKSLNSLIIEALEKQFLYQGGEKKHTDLNHLSGLWADDPEFEQAISAFDKIDDDDWK